MTQFRFDNMEMLWLLLILPVLFGIMMLGNRMKRKKIEKYGNTSLVEQLMPAFSQGRSVFKQILFILAIALVIFALARPQFGTKLKEVKRKGVEIMIALDVSNSMLAEDITPNRLERAKNAISKLVDKLYQDKIGLIVFAGDAYTQIPITSDYSAAKLFMSSINTDIVPKQGTALAEAIKLASNSFGPDEDVGKAIIVITDGEDHEGEAIDAAQKAHEKGIIVHAIGIGKPSGVPIPVYDAYGNKSYRKDRNGNTIITKLNENMLVKMSDAGGGEYKRGANLQQALGKIFDEITKMNKKEYEAKVFSEYNERYHILAFAALLVLVLNFFIMDRKNKYLEKIKLFK